MQEPFQILMVHQVGKCAISARTWVSCIYPMTCKKHQSSCAEITHFPTPLSLHELCLDHGIKLENMTLNMDCNMKFVINSEADATLLCKGVGYIVPVA